MEWRKSNRHRVREYNRTSRARRKNPLVNDLTVDQWRQIVAYFCMLCAYCGEALIQLTQDHIVPLSKGGGHTESNVVPACGHCNSVKRDKNLIEVLHTIRWLKIEVEHGAQLGG